MKRAAWIAPILLFLCFHLPPTAVAQRGVQPPRPKADGAKAKAHLDYLASDAMKGRRSGTPEYRKAAEYVAARFKEYGLRPGGEQGGWFQEVPIKDFREFLPPTRLAITSSPTRRDYFPGYTRDFQPLAGTGRGIVRGRLAFAGYGIISETGGWNDYAGLDVSGRIVMVLAGVQPGATADERLRWTLTRKVAAARERGAVGLIEMNAALPGQRLQTVQRPTSGIGRDGCPPDFVVVRAGANFCDDAFYVAGKSWRAHVSQMLREKKPAPVAIDTTVEMEVHSQWEERSAPNVIGVIPGNDAALANEYLLIGAHLDHEGVGIDGFVYDGADDNASGVSTVLEVARVLHESGFKPRRTLVFCAWMGEEMGLVGSRWYTQHPVFPLERTALYMNMDMVGTGDDDLWVGGLAEFRELFDVIRAGLAPELQHKLRPRLHYSGSDHTSFRQKGVPWISLRSGGLLTASELDDEHPEYHTAGDDPQYIRPELLGQAADYHLQILTHLGNMDRTLLEPRFFTRFIHRDAVLVDMHCDTIARYMAGEDLSKDLPTGHVDIPKLREGGVDLQVFAAYVAVPQNATEKITAAKRAFDQIDAIHRLVEANPNHLSIVLGPRDLVQGETADKTGVLIGVEGGYAIENDLALLRSFHRSGVRLMTLTHWNRTDWADASGDEKAELGGLTEFGEQVVREMNRLGMIVDVSHVHDETFWDVLRVSTRPVVASHSCARGISEHHRNLSDDMLKALAKNGGVVGINFAPFFLNAALDRKQQEIIAAVAKKHGLPVSGWWQAAAPAVREKAEAEVDAGMKEASKTLPVVDVKTVVDHIEHVIKVTGSTDHVGLGSDYDGISSTPRGLEHAGKLIAITEELKARGHNEEDIRKILGGNFMRVFTAVTRPPAT